MKRVLITYNTSHYVYLFRRPLIRALLDRGYQVVLLSPSDEYTPRLVDLGITHEPIAIDSKGMNPFNDLLLLAHLLRTYSRLSPDVVLLFTIKPNVYGGLATSILRIPAIATVTGLGTAFIQKGAVHLASKALYRAAFSRIGHVFFQNETDSADFRRWGIASSATSSIIGGSGVDLDHFYPASKPASELFAFLFIGRMLADKGLEELVEATRILRSRGVSFTCQLLGPVGAENRTAISRAEIAAWEQEGLVQYFPPVDDVRPYIAAADCVVLPSYREGTSKTLLEAAAMCKPLVATDVPGCNNVVLHGANGFLCAARDSRDLADAMQRMASLPDHARAEMGKAARRHVLAKFNQTAVIEAYLTKISDIASDSRVAARGLD